jgi:hypothetical protein
MKEKEDWIKDSIKDLRKSFKNRLRVHRIRKIVRIFNIYTKL